MADNVLVDNGSETDYTVASDDDGTAHHQYVKVEWGGDGTFTKVAAGASALPIQDGGNSITVDGTVTANLGAVDNAVLDAIQAAVETIDNAISGTEMQVDVVTSALPSGAATAANQSTVIGHLDGVEGLLTTIDADTGGILTAVQTLDNAISGNEMQVDVVTAPAAARTTDSIAAALQVDALMSGLTALTPAFAAVAASASGDNTIVAAQGAGNAILVHQVILVAAGAVTVRFEDGAGGTALTGQMALAANSGFVLPFSPVGWFKTSDNTLLNLELSSGVSVAGVIAYTVI